MLKEERQALILNKLHSSGKVVVSRLAVELNVSEDTIRRDLLDLDQKGQVKRVFGGAIPMERPVINFFDRETTDVELKQRLALKALDFLEKDQLLFHCPRLFHEGPGGCNRPGRTAVKGIHDQCGRNRGQPGSALPPGSLLYGCICHPS